MNSKFVILLALSLNLTIFNHFAQAQQPIQADGTLGTIVTTNGNQFTMTGGRSIAPHLFHSFSTFSVPSQGQAIFDLSGQAGVSTIFSRVTGNQVSNLDGLIKTVNGSGPISLFFMNPNGIVFGANAKLDVTGSFVATTANAIQFADGLNNTAAFRSDATTDASLLQVRIPIGLQMVGLQMGSNAGAIEVQGNGHRLTTLLPRSIPVSTLRDPSNTGLALTSGQTLGLIGSEIKLTGGVMTAEQGQIELGAVRSGTVGVNFQSGQAIGFDYANAQTYGEIRLDQRSLLDVSGLRAGSMHLQGQNVRLTTGSALLSQNSGTQAAGEIRLDVQDLVHLKDATPMTQTMIRSESLGLGTGADLKINASNLQVEASATVDAASYGLYGSGRPGSLQINVSDQIQLRGYSQAAPFLPSGISSSTYLQGIGSSTHLIKSRRIEVMEGGVISSSSLGLLRGSDLQVQAADIFVSGFNPVVQIPSVITTTVFGQGMGGDLTVVADRIFLKGIGIISSSTLAAGAAGNLKVTAHQSVEIDGSMASINASADRLSPIFQQAFGLPAIPTGNSGNLYIATPQLHLLKGGEVSVRSDGPGSAGNLTIAANSIFLDQAGQITASTVSGNGGNLKLNLANTLIMRNGSLIASNSQGIGNGGLIWINSPTIVGLENSDISANSVNANGGKIQISTQGLFGLEFRDRLTPDNDITASSDIGLNGTIEVNKFGFFPQTERTTLTHDLRDRQQMATSCQSLNSDRFISTGKGGIPTSPQLRHLNPRSWNDLRGLNSQGLTVSTTPHSVVQTPVEAIAMVRSENGELSLVGYEQIRNIQSTTCSGVN